jgi:hypothetical protein
MYLMYDSYFDTLVAEDIALGDSVLPCLLQTFARNSSIRKIRFSNIGKRFFGQK